MFQIVSICSTSKVHLFDCTYRKTSWSFIAIQHRSPQGSFGEIKMGESMVGRQTSFRPAYNCFQVQND